MRYQSFYVTLHYITTDRAKTETGSIGKSRKQLVVVFTVMLLLFSRQKLASGNSIDIIIVVCEFSFRQTRGTVSTVKLNKDRNVSTLCCCKLPGLSVPESKVIEACQAIDTLDRKVN